MARTTFSGPVKSDNGFEGALTGNVDATTVLTHGVAFDTTTPPTVTGCNRATGDSAPVRPT